MFRKVGEDMEVQNIPIPAPAAIKVTKEGKQGVFETKIIQTTDNFLLKQEWDVVLELVWDVHVK